MDIFKLGDKILALLEWYLVSGITRYHWYFQCLDSRP